MFPRRRFLQASASVPFMFASNAGRQLAKHSISPQPLDDSVWSMPEEGDPHARTWMSFGARKEIWGRRLLKEVQLNLVKLAQTIAQFEPVTICVRPEERKVAERLCKSLENIDFFECRLNDIWIRDFGCVFVVNQEGRKAAVDFNFNAWGEKQDFELDAKVAEKMAATSKSELIETKLCLEGGGIEVDGQGTAIITESCVVNENRNPGWSKADIEEELDRTIGVDNVIWLPGVRGADITDGHTDFYARFASPGVVVAHYDPDRESPEHDLTMQQIDILNNSADANGKKLEIVELTAPSFVRPKFDSDDFCAGYVNFYVCNKAVIAMQFGDMKSDGEAREKLTDCFPGREIVMLNVDGIAAGGGGIHCVTQQEPD